MTKSTTKKEPPMMAQYYRIKMEYPNTILLYRMGDFYETFEEDAKITAKILGLTLTKRNHGGIEETPLAGFPYHAIDKYAHKLVKAGYRVAVCEQIENPKAAKGIVKRDVVEVISSGTGIDDSFLEEKSDNNIICVCEYEGEIGYAICDVSTGNFSTSVSNINEIPQKISRFQPNEILLSDKENNQITTILKNNFPEIPVSFENDDLFMLKSSREEICTHFNAVSVNSLGLEQKNSAVISSAVLLQYVKKLKKNNCGHISSIKIDYAEKNAYLDIATIRNLELLKPIHTDETGGTLVSVLDNTSTSIGSRLLKRWIVTPLADKQEINDRLDAVEYFCKEIEARTSLQDILRQIIDLERIIGRVSLQRVNPRELDGLKNSITLFPKIARLIGNNPLPVISSVVQKINGFEELSQKIAETIVDNPPLSIGDGNLIRSGLNAELDNLRNLQRDTKSFIAKLQEEERQNTGIDNLKVAFNNVFGYFFEVSKSQLNKVPNYFIRKQTIANGERYITPQLKEFEERVLGAEEKIANLENNIFAELKTFVASYCVKIQEAAQNIAILDVLCNFGVIASQNNYCRPILSENSDMLITEGRHPVVEIMTSEQFVPNDTVLNSKKQVLIITGPNMAGKSTYLRQNALIALMAQIGSFVPAKRAQIGIVDKFFTRIGASDRLARGQSTFLVEMIEVANILNNASEKSLVLLDEVGRGTSTFDGLSIAWATAEYLHNNTQTSTRTFFATHYHELTELASICERMENVHISVKEYKGNIIFLRKISQGESPHSYGIKIAQLAGVPQKVVQRAAQILKTLEGREEKQGLDKKISEIKLQNNPQSLPMQISIFETTPQNPVVDIIQKTDIENITPIEALKIFAELKKMC
ncbi:MAG: DNA mismatch repair protein MutS [Chitinispirillales bacterium]|jgi:DNA mismatch repair protein MutS|nr:DNA mismatch repair protein MutS [Chitinispirillales bacterium]